MAGAENEVLYRGTPGDRIVFGMLQRFVSGDLMLAEPWFDDSGNNTLWRRFQVVDDGGLFRRVLQCAQVTVEGDSWSAGGLRIPSVIKPTRDEAMDFVDGELKKLGYWILP